MCFDVDLFAVFTVCLPGYLVCLKVISVMPVIFWSFPLDHPLLTSPSSACCPSPSAPFCSFFPASPAIPLFLPSFSYHRFPSSHPLSSPFLSPSPLSSPVPLFLLPFFTLTFFLLSFLPLSDEMMHKNQEITELKSRIAEVMALIPQPPSYPSKLDSPGPITGKFCPPSMSSSPMLQQQQQGQQVRRIFYFFPPPSLIHDK